MEIKENRKYNIDSKKNDVLDLVKLSIQFINNRDTISAKDLYKLICYFYDVKIEIYDYMGYANRKNNTRYCNIVDIPTNVVTIDWGSEGHGRDFSWWTQNYQRMIKAFSVDFFPSKDEYTIEEIKELVDTGDIFVLYPFGRKTKKKFVNVKDDIDYLVSYQSKELSCDDEYFDYMVFSMLKEIKIENLLNQIRRFIISLKLDSEIDLDYCYDGIEVYKEEADMLIRVFNEKNDNKIQSTSLDIVTDYLRRFNKEDDWYEEVTLEQIMNVFDKIDDVKLQKEIESLVISLKEAELCYEMASNFDWVDKKIMGEIVIKDGNPEINYYFATNVEGADIESHREVILNSEFTDDYILERIKK